YSLGCVLAELLDVDLRAAGARSASSLRPISTGLVDVVRRCLASDPDRRYPDAASLAEDLRRHMADFPFRGVPNPSLRESWRKWLRRQPYALFRVKAALLALGLAGILYAAVWFAFLTPRYRGAAIALLEGRALLDRGDYPGADRALTRGSALLEGLPGADRLRQELSTALGQADDLDELGRLHRLVDRLRLAESVTDRSLPLAKAIARPCRSLWASRLSLLARPVVSADRAVRDRLRDDLLDLAVIGSALRVRLEADPQDVARAHREALALLDQAEALFAPSHVL